MTKGRFTKEVSNSAKCYLKAYGIVTKEFPKFRSKFLLVSALFLFTSALGATLPFLLKRVADTFSHAAETIDSFVLITLAYALVWIISEVLKNIKGIFSAGLLGRSTAAITDVALSALLSAPHSYQKAYDPAVASSNITRGSSAFSALTVAVFWTIIPIAVEICIALFFLNQSLGLVYSGCFFTAVILLIALAIYIAIASRNIHAELMQAQNAVSSYSVNRLGMAFDVRLNNAHKKEGAARSKILADYIKTIEDTNRKMGLLLSVQALAVGVLQGTSMLALLAYREGSHLQAGDFVLIAGYVSMLTMQLRIVAGACIDIQRNITYLSCTLDYTSLSPEGFSASHASVSVDTSPVFEIKKLGADLAGRKLFENLNFSIRQGQLFVISAPSGFGKSTLLNYMLGLESPSEGLILFQGTPVSHTHSDNIISNVGVVAQNTRTIPGTIRDNITYGVENNIDDSTLIEILQTLELIPLGTELPATAYLDRVIDLQGGGLSGGEIQRICIARALARRKKIILMDEPTSSIGQLLAIKIIQYLRQSAATVIIITHDPKIMEMADHTYFPQFTCDTA